MQLSLPGVQTLESILDSQLEFRDNLLQQAETAFLEKWSKDLKSQMLKWCSNLTKLKIKPLVLNFDTFIEQATLIEILARIGEGNNAIEFEEEINPFEMKFDEAIAYALNKKPTLFSELDEINDKVKNNCFWIKRSTELTATEKVLKELQKSLENGGTFKEFMQDIDSVVDKVGMGTNGWYASNVYRTNMMTFYNSGTYKQQMDNITDKPYLLYDGVADNRQSKTCQELDGKVYKATDPIWARIYPPNHYGCRSSVIALSKEEVEAFGLTILSPTKAIKEMDLGGFEGNPFDSYWKKVEKNVKIKEKKVTRKLLNFTLLDEKTNEKLVDVFEKAPDYIKDSVYRTSKEVTITQSKSDYYMRGSSNITYSKTGLSSKNIIAHEYGHYADNKLNLLSGGSIREYLSSPGANNFNTEYCGVIEELAKSLKGIKGKKVREGIKEQALEFFGKQKLFEREYSAFQDILDGLTTSKTTLYYGHGSTYWKNRSNGVYNETFANLFDIYTNVDTIASKEQIEFMDIHFPGLTKSFLELIKKVNGGV